MRKFRQWITSFFGFSRSETNGFLILLPLVAIAIASAPAYRWWKGGTSPHEFDPARLDSMVSLGKVARRPDTLLVQFQRFKFDPNTVRLEQLSRLGFPAQVAERLIHYREKGGRFRTRNDLAKLYGIDSALMTDLHDYIILPQRRPFQTGLRPVRPSSLDLNQADSVQLVGVYGIGPVLSRRIIRYRERLGGFVFMDQLKEIYGLDSIAINELKKRTFIDQGFRPRRININEADEKQLHSSPYINFHLARSIAAYRFQHGVFPSIDALSQVALMNDSLFQKIKPYLTVKD